MPFRQLGLSPEVLRAIAETGYEMPTPIQERSIPSILSGRDILGSAQTGTGKTASFTLPMIDILSAGRVRARMPRSLILEPTRELAAQVAENFDAYGKYSKLTKALLVGGVSFSDQDQKVDRGVDVLIATPGRLLDHVERGKLMLSGVSMLVIDEADRMLDMGFIPDVERIVGLTPRMRQTLMFSATLLPEIRRFAAIFLNNPKEISVDPPASTVDRVTQGLAVTHPDDKIEVLRQLLSQREIVSALIFCNRKRDVDMLATSLRRNGVEASGLHGDMNQAIRTQTLSRFRAGEISILVASDVAARGLDIEALPNVVNFDVPIHAEDYIHRIGRTARAGMEGAAYTLATPEDAPYLEAIATLTGSQIPRIEIDGVTQVELDADARPARRGRGGRRSAGNGPTKRGPARPARGRGRGRAAATPEPQPEHRAETVAGETPKTADTPQVEPTAADGGSVTAPRPRRRPAAKAKPAPTAQPSAPTELGSEAARPASDHGTEPLDTNGGSIAPAQPRGRSATATKRSRQSTSAWGANSPVPAFLLKPTATGGRSKS
jgi:superfamily II DNA/RNA helicase